jgi:uncharacterized membrane protein YqjE
MSLTAAVGAPTGGDATCSALDALRILRSAGGSMLGQAALHAQLVQVEWAQEQRRLLQLLLVTLLGCTGLACVLLGGGGLLMALAWDTAMRVPCALLLLGSYALGTWVAWRRFSALAKLGGQSFSASREQWSADLALFRSSQ